MDNTVKFALSDIQYYQNDDSVEFAIARLAVLSTKQNSHRLNITKEMLKRDGASVLGKWIIADYDGFDVTTHTDNVHIVGVVPHDAKIDFIDNDDGTVTMWVDAIISKLYATQVYELFKNKNFRNVSVEMTTKNNTEQIDGSISIDGFTIYAICILGQHINGSCPDAHMEIIKFSADKAEKFYKQTSILDKMAKLASANNKQETEVLDTLNPIYNKLNLKDETVNNDETKGDDKMAKLEEKEKDVVMDKPTDEVSNTEEKKEEKLSEVKDTKDEENKEEKTEEKMSENSESSDSEKDKEEDKVEEKKASDDSEEKDKEEEDKFAEKEARCAELEAKCAKLEAKCAKLEAKLSELEKFKANTEEKEKMTIVTQTLAEVKESMKDDEFAKFEEKAKNCTLENVNAWRNEVLANVATVLMSKQKEESHLRFGDIEEVPKKTSLWDRM